MREYTIRRLLLIIPTLIIVSVLAFSVMRLLPGDAVELMVEEHGYAENTAELRHMLGLDKPIHVQYGEWAGKALHGDLGESLWTNQSISQELGNRFSVTLELALLALFFTIVIGIPLGAYSAIRQDTVGDYVGRSIAIGALSVPTFWVGTLCVVFFSIYLNWTPAMVLTPFRENPIRNLSQYIIPAIILGLVCAGFVMRMTRTMMLEVLRQDYIRTAWAKGLTERIVVIRHALRNALIPVVSIIGLQIPLLIGGAVVVESIFNLPGMGRLVLDVLNNRDYPMLSGIILFLAIIVLFVNLAVDLSYAYLNPKIRYQSK